MEERNSQSDSDGIYWPEGESQEEFWNQAAAAEDIKVAEPSNVNAADNTRTKVGRSRDDNHPEAESPHGAKRARLSSDAEEEYEVFSLVFDGRKKIAPLGSDDDALWAQFPSSEVDVDEPIATQPSFDFSGDGSRDTSLTSLESSASNKSLKRKRSSRPATRSSRKAENAVASSSKSSESYRSAGVHVSVDGIGATTPEPGFAVIAYDRRAQGLMDKLDIAWGTQYEIARGVCNGSWYWSDVTEAKLKLLRGNNEESAHRVANVLRGSSSAKEVTDHSLWLELDREQDAILEDKNRSLGLQGHWKGKDNWHGGKIQQIARIEKSTDNPSMPFTLTLERMQMTRCHRFARFLGSRRLLLVKLPRKSKDVRPERQLFERKFVLCGRVFVALAAKDSKVYLMEIDEDYDIHKPLVSQGDQFRQSLEEFVTWHNPMHLNGSQPVAKWVTRFDLGLSTTVPTIKFEPENVAFIPDLYAPHAGSKIPAEKIYTDGCGYMNRAALSAIARITGDPEPPTAVQGRILGSKGLWVLHPHDHHIAEGNPPKIWIRQSQRKVQLANSDDAEHLAKLHPAHLIFDLVAPSRTSIATRLNRLAILCLAHNGVPKASFVRLMRDGLRREIEPLTQWQRPNAMSLLWHAINKSTGSYASRLQQFASGSQRALGLSRRSDVDDDTDEGHDDAVSSAQSLSARCFESGKPLSLGDFMLDTIRAGFSPMEDEYIYQELRHLVDMIIGNYIKRHHIPVQCSADAFIVPDPYGVLKENEIHFISSKPLPDPHDSVTSRTIVGDVLIYRNPARLPSDVRKVKAVECKSLEKYTDVIVLPTEGPCSLASLLAGGDVDGDVAICIWDPDLVDSFHNSPVVPVPAAFMRNNFKPESEITTVASANEKMQSSPETSQLALRRYLLSGLTDSIIGIYSKFHENLVYAKGYDHEETMRAAFMFTVLLDSRKTGHIVRANIFRDDKKKYDRDPPPCMVEHDYAEGLNPNYLKRQKGLQSFILEELLTEGKDLQTQHLRKYDELGRHFAKKGGRDEALVQVYKRYSDMAIYRDEVAVVKAFVDRLRTRWVEIWAESPLKRTATKDKATKKTSDNTKLRALIADFIRGPDEAETRGLRAITVLGTVAASYAYSLSPKFAFTVAFRELTAIKANACGLAPTCLSVGAAMTIPASSARVLDRNAGGI